MKLILYIYFKWTKLQNSEIIYFFLTNKFSFIDKNFVQGKGRYLGSTCLAPGPGGQGRSTTRPDKHSSVVLVPCKR